MRKITLFIAIILLVAFLTVTLTMQQHVILIRQQAEKNLLRSFGHGPQDDNDSKLTIMKDVGEASMEHFGLTETDFKLLKKAQIDVIEGNFDICADDEDVEYFLEQSQSHGLKVIMSAGSGEAEWGYTCDQSSFPKDQKPVWKKKDVVAWVHKWKDHPAIYGWDISNEAGSVMPAASWHNEKDASVPDMLYISVDQLKIAYKDVKAVDPTRPIMIRMNGWFFYDYDDNFFRPGNPFDKNVADIVMINAYSNVSDYYPDFVSTVSQRAKEALWNKDPDVKVVIALGAWEEKPLWMRPTVEHFKHDLAVVQNQPDISGIAYFKYGAKNSEWYLPDSKSGDPKLWNNIKDK